MKNSATFRAAVVGLFLVGATSLAWGVDPVSRSPLGTDPAYKSLSPMDQLKKLAELAAAKTAPADLNLLQQDAARRYVHSESKGKLAAERPVIQKLTEESNTGALKGLTWGSYGIPFMEISYGAALLDDPSWKTGDAKAKLELIKTWEKDGFVLQNTTMYFAEWVILEHLAPKVASVAVKDRGLAKLKALAEIAGPDSFKGTYVDTSPASWIWDEALAEHLAFLPEWGTMKAPERVRYLQKLFGDLKMNQWAGQAVLYCAARDALRADARFTGAADAAAKSKAVKDFCGEQKLGNFLSQMLQRFAEGKEERSGKGDKIDDMAAALGPVTDADAALKKLRDLTTTNMFEWNDVNALAMPLAKRLVLPGDASKPATAASEVAKWKPLRDNDNKAGLKMVPINSIGPVDLSALAGAIITDPTYAKATWLSRAQLLDKVQAGYPTFGSPLFRPRQVMTRLAVVTETGTATAATRGEAELRAIQKMRPTGTNEQMQDTALRDLTSIAIYDHFSEHPAAGKAKFAQLTTWLNAKLITFEIAKDPIVQITVEMLEADPAFTKADAAGKKKIVDDMATKKQLDFFTSNDVKRFFKL